MKPPCRDIRILVEEQECTVRQMRKELSEVWPVPCEHQSNASGVNCMTVLLRFLVRHTASKYITRVATEDIEENCPLVRHALLTFDKTYDHVAALDDLARAVWSKGSFAQVPKEEVTFLKLLERPDVMNHIWPYFLMNMYDDVHYATKGAWYNLSYRCHPEGRTAEMEQLMATGWPGRFTITPSRRDYITDMLVPMFDKTSPRTGHFLLPQPNFGGDFGHIMVVVGASGVRFDSLRFYHNYKRNLKRNLKGYSPQGGGPSNEWDDSSLLWDSLEWETEVEPYRYALIVMVKCGTGGKPDCIRTWHRDGEPIQPVESQRLGSYWDSSWRCDDLEPGTKLFCLYVKVRRDESV